MNTINTLAATGNELTIEQLDEVDGGLYFPYPYPFPYPFPFPFPDPFPFPYSPGGPGTPAVS